MRKVAVIVALALVAPASASSPGVVHATTGAGLYAANCAKCHGPDGEGSSGPNLGGVGALAADFYLRTGYMPLARVGEQPVASRVLFSQRELRQLIAYVASLGGPPPPTPDPASGSVAEGRELFTLHCSGCHQVVAEGGVMPGAKAPPLKRATPQQIAEAVRIGPYVMPRFSARDISDAELDSLIAYVDYAKRPDDAGGWAIDHLGPFPEGMVTWGIAGVVLVATCMLLGERLKRP